VLLLPSSSGTHTAVEEIAGELLYQDDDLARSKIEVGLRTVILSDRVHTLCHTSRHQMNNGSTNKMSPWLDIGKTW